MVISSRAVRVALLLAGVVLLTGRARAAEPSYEDYVAQVKAGKLDVDYAAFRLAYAASPKYDPYGTTRVLMGQMKKAFAAGDCTVATAQAKELLEANFVHIDAHATVALCEKKAGHEDEARREFTIVSGLIKSVLKSGDGKSPQTAFVVIAIDEEYSVMGVLGLAPGDQALVSEGGSSFDKFDTRKRGSDEPVTLYFNIDRPQAQLARMLQQSQPKQPAK